MPRQLNRLVPLTVSRLEKPGMYPDGGGLYLQISKQGNKAWIFRYAMNGKDRQMGLGPLHTISLAVARTKAKACREARLDGRDPLDDRKAARQAIAADKAKRVTFKECAQKYIADHKAGWKNEKHARQWESSLELYAYPIFGHLTVGDVDLSLIMKVLEPIWTTKTETAKRLRGRIETVLDAATVKGHRLGDNPARWRGHLDKLLPTPAKVSKVEHFAALPYAEMADFMAKLREQDSIAALALEFAILTASRTAAVVGMPWSEVDLDHALWIIPKERMKAEREHRVPLSKAAVALLRRLKESSNGPFVFPSRKAGRHLSNMAMLQLLKRMKRSDITVHGFRSTFRDWAAETTNFPTEVAEMALAHAVSDKVEAAYRRGDLFMKRRRIMEKWAEHCSRNVQTGTVVLIQAA